MVEKIEKFRKIENLNDEKDFNNLFKLFGMNDEELKG